MRFFAISSAAILVVAAGPTIIVTALSEDLANQPGYTGTSSAIRTLAPSNCPLGLSLALASFLAASNGSRRPKMEHFSQASSHYCGVSARFPHIISTTPPPAPDGHRSDTAGLPN
jgi:hypothetical protein